jgi:hypothetical protein
VVIGLGVAIVVVKHVRFVCNLCEYVEQLMEILRWEDMVRIECVYKGRKQLHIKGGGSSWLPTTFLSSSGVELHSLAGVECGVFSASVVVQ